MREKRILRKDTGSKLINARGLRENHCLIFYDSVIGLYRCALILADDVEFVLGILGREDELNSNLLRVKVSDAENRTELVLVVCGNIACCAVRLGH